MYRNNIRWENFPKWRLFINKQFAYNQIKSSGNDTLSPVLRAFFCWISGSKTPQFSNQARNHNTPVSSEIDAPILISTVYDDWRPDRTCVHFKNYATISWLTCWAVDWEIGDSKTHQGRNINFEAYATLTSVCQLNYGELAYTHTCTVQRRAMLKSIRGGDGEDWSIGWSEKTKMWSFEKQLWPKVA